jgi:carbon-monoxide dehydrogenase medium subunit
MNVKAYLTPGSVDECLSHLIEFDGRGRLIAGGTDLVLDLQRQRLSAEVLIDISSIEELAGLEVENDELIISAGATHAQVNRDKRIRELWPALSKACGSIGSPQIRNVATVVGNVVNAQPAADSAVALCALGARVEIASSAGRRVEAIEDLYAGLGLSKIDSTREVVINIKVPKPDPGQTNAYGRISLRSSLSLPVVNAAVRLETDRRKILSARLAIGPVADRPFRPLKAEAALKGIALNDSEAFDEAALIAGREGNPRDSCLRGSSGYRRQLLRVLIRNVLKEAVSWAHGEAHHA